MNITVDEQEESVAALVHHFVLPEVQKQLVRKKIQKRQKENLRAIHDSIYSEMEEVEIVKNEENATENI